MKMTFLPKYKYDAINIIKMTITMALLYAYLSFFWQVIWVYYKIEYIP